MVMITTFYGCIEVFIANVMKCEASLNLKICMHYITVFLSDESNFLDCVEALHVQCG